MRFLGVVIVVSLVYGGCSAPDPGSVNYNDDRKPNNARGGSTVAPGAGAGAGTPGGATPGGTAGGTPGGTAGGTPGGTAGGVDAGQQAVFAGAYATGKPAQSATAAHQGKAGAPGVTGRGTDCMTCHVTGGAAGGKPFMFGGTVFSDAAGATPAVDAEIGVLLPNGTRLKTNSDDQGNFWLADAQALPAGSKTAARTAASQKPMISAATGACNAAGCHAVGATVLKTQ